MDKSTAEVIDGLYETIWAISDAIGVNLEVIANQIPQKHIDPPALAKRLLVDSMARVAQNLELLRCLEENVKSGTAEN